MKVGIFVSSLKTSGAGGVAEVVKNQLIEFSKYPINIDVHHFSKIESDSLIRSNNITYHSHSINPFKSYNYSSSLRNSIEEMNFDILHTHGLWEYISVAAYKWKKIHKKPLMISTHGMLDSWALKNSYLKKKFLYYIVEKKYLSSADCIHVLSQNEANSLKKIRINVPYCLLPNGLNLKSASKLPVIVNELYPDKKKLLFLSRLHPKKGILQLLHGWKLFISSYPLASQWIFLIAGWGEEEFIKKIKLYIDKNKLGDSVKLLGPKFNSEKEKLFTQVDMFILPSLSEGFPIVVLEAWAYKLPVLITKECNIPDAFVHNAAIEITPDTLDISNKLKFACGLGDDEINKIGENGFELLKAKYTWEENVQKIIGVFEWLTGNRKKPNFIY